MRNIQIVKKDIVRKIIFKSGVFLSVSFLLFSVESGVLARQMTDWGNGWENNTYGYGFQLSSAIPTKPTSVMITSKNALSVKVTWQKPLTSEDGLPYDNHKDYLVYRSDKNGEYIRTAVTADTSYTDQSVNSDTTYIYKIQARDTKNNISKLSNPAVARTKSGAPNNLKVTNKTNNSITISWLPPNDLGVSVGLYEIYMSTSTKGNFDMIGRTGDTRFTVENLVKRVPYYFKVRASSTDGIQGGFSRLLPGVI